LAPDHRLLLHGEAADLARPPPVRAGPSPWGKRGGRLNLRVATLIGICFMAPSRARLASPFPKWEEPAPCRRELVESDDDQRDAAAGK
jgi:hypothetical protein